MIPYRNSLDLLHDYVPGKSMDEIREKYGLSHVVKLASNENPLGPSPQAIQALCSTASQAHLYPRGDSPLLRQTLAQQLGIPEAQFIFGNGSDEVISFICFAYLEKGLSALSCQPSFSVYESATRLMGADYRTIPLKEHRFDLQGLASACTPEVRVMFICNPNNPTGTYVGQGELEEFLTAVPPHVLVVLDQAYCEFATATDYPDMRSSLERFPNLLLLRTFSKLYGLAGVRIGYGIGNPEVIRTLWKVKPPFNVSLPAQSAAVAALLDTQHIAHTLSNNQMGMQLLYEGLAELGISALPSQANFLCAHFGTHALGLVTWLESQGIIVRSLRNFGMPEWIRISVGTPVENQQFLSALHLARQSGVF